jgi:hypothetical protein
MIYPMLRTFDRSDTNLTCVRRERANTPLQALTLLNDPQFFEAYRALGVDLLRDPHQTTAERIETLVMRCLSREPLPAERGVMAELFESLRRITRKRPAQRTTPSGRPPALWQPARTWPPGSESGG